jgi:tRNA nucleotidyltransferase (CCA-adding enzyme)
VDLTVEGDAVAFARRLGRRVRARVRAHPRFGTATLDLADGSRVDVNGSRREIYSRRGALPSVSPAPLAEDPARRDFTVNAMLLVLSPGPPRLLDPHDGRRDLARRRIRMLHRGSPHDDPTRAYRAVRYANRLGFRIDAATRRWIREALEAGAFEEISADRRRREIERILSEPRADRALSLLARLGLLATIHPALSADRRVRARMARAERTPDASWFTQLLVLASGLSEQEAGELAVRLNLPRAPARVLRRWPERVGGNSGGSETAEERAALEAVFGRHRRSLAGGLAIGGRDLVRAGIAPGPRIGRALAATRAARRGGRLAPGDELAFAVAHAREGGA